MNKFSQKVQNTLMESKKVIYQVPECYRKELCTSVKGALAAPDSYVFRHSENIVIHAFNRIYTLYNLLCPEDKEQFLTAFTQTIY